MSLAVELLIFALLGLHGTVPTIVLLLEACPCAAITTMFAIQFHHDEELAAGAVVFSTLSSISDPAAVCTAADDGVRVK